VNIIQTFLNDLFERDSSLKVLYHDAGHQGASFCKFLGMLVLDADEKAG
jgi:hypothetical protein